MPIYPTEVLTGAMAFMEQVQRAGKRMALSSDSKNARSVLKSTDMETFFDVIIDGNDIRRSKPHPECFLLAAAALGYVPGDCLVFEDAAIGVAAGVAGGFSVVGVGDRQHLPNARTVIPGFQGLSFPELLCQMQATEAQGLALSV